MFTNTYHIITVIRHMRITRDICKTKILNCRIILRRRNFGLVLLKELKMVAVPPSEGLNLVGC